MKILKVAEITPWILLSLIAVGSFLLSLSASQQESAIMDELANIPAGYGYVRYLDYRLNPEHPPLIKALAALPLLFGNFHFPTGSSAWQEDVNGQWEMGNRFLYESTPVGGQAGNDADEIIQTSRFGPLLITLLLIIFIYVWAKELMGRWWALFPAFLFAFSPTVLAHGHYVTTDVGAAFGIFIAVYYFVKFILQPSKKNLIWLGLAFGIAQLMKFSAVLLIPLFIFLLFVFYLWKCFSDLPQATLLGKIKRIIIHGIRYLRALILIFAIGYLLVYVFYFVFTINYPVEKQRADTEFTLASFAGGPDPDLQTCKLNSGVSASRHMRCLAEINIGMTRNPILRPLAQYLLGVLMVLQRSAGGNTAYFLGEVSASGWWYYFPVVFVLKEPIPSLILIALALILSIWKILKTINYKLKTISDYLGTNFAEFSMLSFIVLYCVYSIKSPLNIGVRHILPTVPFLYILTAGSLKKWVSERRFSIKASFKWVLLAVLLVWYLTESLFNYPHFLSYFNQFAGGTDYGYKYVTDSNYDWGQDLKRLKSFVETWNMKHETKIDKIAVDYFGGGNPQYYLGDKVEYWQSAKGNPLNEGISWLAISINTLQGAKGELHPGQSRNSEDEYLWLKNPYEPFARAGKSIFIYKLE